jgi:O-antigen/teichoic acid export membrane protein
MTISKAKTFRNIAYSGFGKGLTLVCGALASMVVARNITPYDYGVVGFAWIIIAFLSQFSDLGVGNAVIRRPELHPQNLRTAFTLKLVLGCGACAGAFLIAPFARHLFDHPATGNVIRVLSLTFLVSTIGFIPQVMLTREMNYRALMIPGVAGAVAQCILAVTLVLHGWSYWAVVIGSVGAALVSGITMQLIARIPIGFRFDLANAKEFLRFGIPLFGSGILIFLVLNIDNFLVGKSMGSVKLGYYALAFTWGSFICVLLNDTVNSVLLPTLSAIQADTVAMRRWYLKTIELTSFIAASANTSLLANAPFFLVTFLGKGTGKWLPATMALRILCIYGIVRAITVPVGICIMVRGRTKVLFRANAIAGAIELLLLLVAVKLDRIELAALAVLIAYLTQSVVYIPYLREELQITFGNLVARLWPVAPAVAAGYLITPLLPNTFGDTLPTLALRLLFTASIVAFIHGILTRFRCFQEARGMIAQNLARVWA